MEYHKQEDEGEERHEQTRPVAKASEEHIIDVVQLGLAQLQGMNILLIVGIVGRGRGRTIPLLHFQLEGLGLDGLVGIGIGIVIEAGMV